MSVFEDFYFFIFYFFVILAVDIPCVLFVFIYDLPTEDITEN